MRVMLVEDHEIVRAGLKTLLEMDERIQVVATESSAREALAKLEVMPIDLLVADISLPQEDGIWLTRQVTSRFPSTSVMVLTMHTESEIVTAALDAGAKAYLTKWASREELGQALNAVLAGASYIQPSIANVVLSAFRTRKSEPKSNVEGLSEREVEVLRLAAKGLRNHEIAQRLNLSLSTVKTHFRTLFRKLDVSDRTQAILAGFNRRIIDKTSLVLAGITPLVKVLSYLETT